MAGGRRRLLSNSQKSPDAATVVASPQRLWVLLFSRTALPSWRRIAMDSLQSYDNPLVGRYASKEMAQLWGPQRKFATWRRLWVAPTWRSISLSSRSKKSPLAPGAVRSDPGQTRTAGGPAGAALLPVAPSEPFRVLCRARGDRTGRRSGSARAGRGR